MVVVPYVESQQIDLAVEMLEELELAPNVVQYNYHPTVPENTVIRIDPPSGRSIKQGRSVQLYVSKGKQEIQVPSLIGKTMDEVALILSNTNIIVEEVEPEYSIKYEKGVIVSQVPQADQYMFDYGVLQISLSQGMPVTFDVIDMTDDAITIFVTFDLVEPGDMQHIEIFDSVDGNNNILYTDYHYFGDSIQQQFTINKSAVISIYQDSELLIKKQFLDDDYDQSL